MKILYLHQYFNLPTDVGSTRSYEMARRLVAAGHEVHMITSDRHGKFSGRGWHVTREAGIEVHWLPVPYDNKMPYGQRIKAFLIFAYAAARRAASISADVVFATSTPLTIAIPGIYAAKRQKIPMVFEVRDLWPELPIAVGALKWPMTWFARWLERFSYKNAERIVALSPGMKKGIVKTGYSDSRVHVIPNTADLELFGVAPEEGHAFRRGQEWLKEKPLVIYAGTLGKINGVSYMVRLAAETEKLDPDIRFLVIGDGAEKEKVKACAQELGVLNKTFFMMSPLPKKEMPAVLSASEIAISLFVDLPQMWANSANKFFDALAAGTPLAINYLGWQADLLREAEAGIVLPARDINKAALELVTFLHDREKLERAGRAARDLAESHFNRDDLAKKLEAVLIRAVSEHKKAQGPYAKTQKTRP